MKSRLKKDPEFEDLFEIKDHDLEETLERYLDADTRHEEKPRLINFVTLSGFAFLITGFLAVMQSIFSIGTGLDGLIRLLPLIGGILVLLVGMGLFSAEPKKKRKSVIQSERLKSRETAKKVDDAGQEVDDYAFLQPRKLMRSRYDSRLFGVCGGVARYLGFDSTLVRILFVAGIFFGYGSPILLYFALAILLPKEPKKRL